MAGGITQHTAQHIAQHITQRTGTAIAALMTQHDAWLDLLNAEIHRPTPVRADDVALVERSLRRLESAKLALLAKADRQRVAEGTGATSTGSWVSAVTKNGGRAGAADVALATALDESLPATKAALGEGEFSRDSASIIARTMKKLPESLTPTERAKVEDKLVRDAKTLDPGKLSKAANFALAAAEKTAEEIAQHQEDVLVDQETRAYQQSTLTLADRGDGTTGIRGVVPTPVADILRTAVQAMISPTRDHLTKGTGSGAKGIGSGAAASGKSSGGAGRSGAGASGKSRGGAGRSGAGRSGADGSPRGGLGVGGTRCAGGCGSGTGTGSPERGSENDGTALTGRDLRRQALRDLGSLEDNMRLEHPSLFGDTAESSGTSVPSGDVFDTDTATTTGNTDTTTDTTDTDTTDTDTTDTGNTDTTTGARGGSDSVSLDRDGFESADRGSHDSTIACTCGDDVDYVEPELATTTRNSDWDNLDWEHKRGRALVDLLEHLDTSRLSSKVAATVVVTFTLEQALAAAHAATFAEVTGTEPSPSVGTVRTNTGTAISTEQARRLACNAGVLPAILDGKSLPLDLGRQARFFSEAQRVALATVYDECAADGCDRPYAWSELHHEDPWASGGETDLGLAIPLCGAHHRLIHTTRVGHTLVTDPTTGKKTVTFGGNTTKSSWHTAA